MKPLWTSADIAAATGGVEIGAFSVSGLATDSREIEPGWGFIALKGTAMDGHAFVAAALEKGAAGALVETSEAIACPHVRVNNTTDALNALGAASRARTQATIIGVTGSVGKTGVKEAVRLCLERDRPGEVHASVKSYNNHVGVPLSLARMPAEMRYGVFEMGMNHAGELTRLTALARPHIAIITTVASGHREFFESEEAIADAKGEIFSGLVPGGIAILNRDNHHFDRLLSHAKNSPAGRILSFGLESPAADVRALSVAPFAEGTAITAQVLDEILSFKVGLPGRHWALNALGVLAIIKAAGADLALAGLALAEMAGLEGRGARTLVEIESGEFTLIDEAYNANPASMAAALSVLGVAQPGPRGRRMAILGDMKELGASSQEFHEALAEPIFEARVEHLILVGEAISTLATRIQSKCNVVCVRDADAALAEAQSSVRSGDVVLVKGSNSMKLARVVAGLKQQKGA